MSFLKKLLLPAAGAAAGFLVGGPAGAYAGTKLGGATGSLLGAKIGSYAGAGLGFMAGGGDKLVSNLFKQPDYGSFRPQQQAAPAFEMPPMLMPMGFPIPPPPQSPVNDEESQEERSKAAYLAQKLAAQGGRSSTIKAGRKIALRKRQEEVQARGG